MVHTMILQEQRKQAPTYRLLGDNVLGGGLHGLLLLRGFDGRHFGNESDSVSGKQVDNFGSRMRHWWVEIAYVFLESLKIKGDNTEDNREGGPGRKARVTPGFKPTEVGLTDGQQGSKWLLLCMLLGLNNSGTPAHSLTDWLTQ